MWKMLTMLYHRQGCRQEAARGADRATLQAGLQAGGCARDRATLQAGLQAG